MIRARFLAVFAILTLSLTSCHPEPPPTGFLWFGQGGRLKVLDFSDQSMSGPERLAECDEAAADPEGRSLAFLCTQDGGKTALVFSLLTDRLEPAVTGLNGSATDPMLARGGERMLFRVPASGDVFDAHLLFIGSSSARLAHGVNAAAFGVDSGSVYLGRGSQLVSYAIDDPTRETDASRLTPLFSGPGTVRDAAYHTDVKRIAVCAGTQVITCDLTGENVRTLYDSLDGGAPGPLRLPYRVRWSPDGRRLAVILSTDGVRGRFVLLNLRDGRAEVVPGAAPKVGGFAWTGHRPVTL